MVRLQLYPCARSNDQYTAIEEHIKGLFESTLSWIYSLERSFECFTMQNNRSKSKTSLLMITWKISFQMRIIQFSKF